MTTATVPQALLDPVIAYFNPRRVILFGSAAYAAATEGVIVYERRRRGR